MRSALAGLLFLLSRNIWACGYCVEDRIAAVYDHAAMTRAVEARQTVVYFAIDGVVRADGAARIRLERALSSVPQANVLKVSAELPAAAIAFDPRRTSLVRIEAELDRKLQPLGLTVLRLQVVEGPARPR